MLIFSSVYIHKRLLVFFEVKADVHKRGRPKVYIIFGQ